MATEIKVREMPKNRQNTKREVTLLGGTQKTHRPI